MCVTSESAAAGRVTEQPSPVRRGLLSQIGVNAAPPAEPRPRRRRERQTGPRLVGGLQGGPSVRVYCSVATWDCGYPIIVPSVPYPVVLVPVMQVDPIMPPAVQSA